MKKRIPKFSNVLYSLRYYHRRSSQQKIMDTLARNGWKNIGQGVCKCVFAHSRYPRVVIKVFWSRSGWKSDPQILGSIPTHLKPHWLAYTFACKKFVVQPRLDRKRSGTIDWELFRTTLDPYMEFDLHWQNVGLYKGRPVIIDLWTS